MSRPRIYDYDALAGELYDALAGLPAQVECRHGVRGLDIYQIEERLGVPTIHCHGTIRHLRLMFGEGDEIGLPCHACDGPRHIYHLTASLEVANPWVQTRLKAQISQLQTAIAFWQAMARAHPAATLDGQRSRLNITTLQNALAVLETMRVEDMVDVHG